MKVNNTISFLFAFSLIILINTPSIKVIFYSTELINLLGTFLLVSVSIIRVSKDKSIKFNNSKMIAIFLILFLWIILFVSYYWSPATINMRNFAQYLSVFVVSICVLLFAKKTDLKYFLPLQFIWSITIAILQISVGIKIDSSLGQHYLTVGFPMGIGLIISGGYILKNVNLKEKKKVVIFLLLFIVLLIALISTRGRSPVIFSILVFFLFWIIFSYKQAKDRIKNTLVIITTGTLAYFIFIKYASDQWLDRFNRLAESTEAEPRTLIYSRALNLVMQKPNFGYGLGSYNYITGSNYPHNIFLEITFYSGILGFIAFLSFIFIYLLSTLKAFRNNNNFELIILSMISMFCFLTWNVSYSLSNSYILFITLCFVIAVVNRKSISIQ